MVLLRLKQQFHGQDEQKLSEKKVNPWPLSCTEKDQPTKTASMLIGYESALPELKRENIHSFGMCLKNGTFRSTPCILYRLVCLLMYA